MAVMRLTAAEVVAQAERALELEHVGVGPSITRRTIGQRPACRLVPLSDDPQRAAPRC